MSGLQQWYFSPIDMLKTPSTVHGCTLEEELSARQKGVELLLRVAGPVNAFVAAAAYFHRFYMRNSIKDYNYRVNYTVCLLVEECGRKLKDVATTVIFKTNASLKPDTDIQVLENSKVCTVSCGGVPRWSYLSKEHKKWTENILVYEETLLDSLCFDLVVESPHACLATAFNSAAVGTGQHEIFQVMDIAFPQDSAPEEQQVLDSVVLNAWGIAHDTYVMTDTYFPSPFDRYLSADPSMLVWLEKFSLRSSDIQQISDCIFIMLCFYKTSEPNERIQSPIPYQQLVPPTLAAVQWPPTSTPASSQPTHEQTNVVDQRLASAQPGHSMFLALMEPSAPINCFIDEERTYHGKNVSGCRRLQTICFSTNVPRAISEKLSLTIELTAVLDELLVDLPVGHRQTLVCCVRRHSQLTKYSSRIGAYGVVLLVHLALTYGTRSMIHRSSMANSENYWQVQHHRQHTGDSNLKTRITGTTRSHDWRDDVVSTAEAGV
ncbi:hypothetical protein AG1IA_00404 [Rhizoctonia solani AG-1 IA]|uniref:Cyclin domain-containing protein n=1 Tax=Thanatephorus cucumeris (strain AG1-IA) TaxID=983506 RepID=L8X5C4_THACA|nr:hypothetical protein AG1IA_00404 [Rhizoctonia solani AG-1 IA]